MALQEFRDWLTSQPQIKQVIDPSLTEYPQLKMFRTEDAEKPSETLFATAVPFSMVREMLEEKNLVNNGYADL